MKMDTYEFVKRKRTAAEAEQEEQASCCEVKVSRTTYFVDVCGVSVEYALGLKSRHPFQGDKGVNTPLLDHDTQMKH